MIREDEFLMLLNSAPVIDGVVTETLTDVGLRRLREDLRRVILEEAEPSVLAPYLTGFSKRPSIDAEGVHWTLTGPADRMPLAEIVLEWSRVTTEMPGRLRPCGNPECNKFLIDHSKPNTARWCSMASCGNRMKARRFQARHSGASL
ncbi:CGNR zinc finger domain-containing protein [Leifsonia sp. NPDC056665]|uniref:CGNR zinc finger domain-containing protein n=1 Tax=Leifsonia sp. NPDC056665 TaxID=3345901 RepID=UPI0036AF73C8